MMAKGSCAHINANKKNKSGSGLAIQHFGRVAGRKALKKAI